MISNSVCKFFEVTFMCYFTMGMETNIRYGTVGVGI